MEYIEIEGFKIAVKGGGNIKNLSLRMAPGKGAWVNVPYGFSKSQVVKFIEEHKDWIKQNFAKFESLHLTNKYSIGDKISTRLHVVEIEENRGAGFASRRVGRRVVIYVPSLIKEGVLDSVVDKVLVEVMRSECAELLPARVKMLADKYGFKYGKLSFRNNSTNWGSCSGTNNISLNVKLMKMRDQVIDYVILHELCHTVVKNHSDDFWRLMTKVCPNWQALRRELRGVK